MKETAVFYRNKLLRGLYAGLLKPVFFRNDPEAVHDKMVKMGSWLGEMGLGRAATKSLFGYENASLEQDILGICFKNPVGLAAGFDKNAELTQILPSVGFGFIEVGSITGEPCLGNPKPRLWRLPESKSLVVYYGLKNEGCEALSKKLEGKHFRMPIGVSVAMTNSKENLETDNAIQDFAKAFRIMEPSASYLTVNISCPNTLGGQPFINPQNLELLLTALDKIPTNKPVFIKLSPDLSLQDLDALLDIAQAHRIHGIICANLTKKRDNPEIKETVIPQVGGLSGKVVGGLSDKMLSYIYKKEGGRFVLVGCGGIFTAEDAYKKIRLGASLLQLATGMIYQGPQAISEINQGLAELLRRDGFKNIREAVGADNK